MILAIYFNPNKFKYAFGSQNPYLSETRNLVSCQVNKVGFFGLIFILINSIFPQDNLYHANQNLEGSYEKIHYSIINGGT